MQALYDASEEPGTFSADVRVDSQACAALLKPVKPGGPGFAGGSSMDPERILLPDTSLLGTSPLWASQAEVAIATVSLNADGQQLPDTFYPYYGSTVRPRVVPRASRTFQSEFRPYGVVPISQPAGATVRAQLTAERIREQSFALSAVLSEQATAAVRFAVVEAHVAAGVLAAAEDARRAILCAVGICGSRSEDMWPPGSVVAEGLLRPAHKSGTLVPIQRTRPASRI